MKTRLKILLANLCILLSLACLAQTEIGGVINVDSTLRKSKSPYIVTSSIVVLQSVKLTIEPGVEIRFNENTLLQVRGTLIAEGTMIDSITFTSNLMKEIGSWEGISVIVRLGGKYKFKYCNIYYSELGIFDNDILGGGGGVNPVISVDHTISNSKFAFNFNAVSGLSNFTMYINECYFYENNYAISGSTKIINNSVFDLNNFGLHSTFYLKVLNSTFKNHRESALLSGAGTLDTIINCTINNNDVGVDFGDYNGFQLINNKIYDNNIGLLIKISTTSPLFVNNSICNNATYNVKITSQVDVDLKNNCWCTTDVNVIQSKIYDVYDDIQLGMVSFNTNYDCNFKEDKESTDTLSISGLVHQGSGLLSDGVVMAVEKASGKARYQKVSNGVFKLDSLRKSEYILYAIPNPVTVTGYLPTYYVNKVKLSEATPLNLLGKIKDVDIYLAAKPSVALGNYAIQGRFSYADNNTDDTTVFAKSWFATSFTPASPIMITENPCKNLPVVLYNSNNQLVQSTVTDLDGYFVFNNLTSGTYKAQGQRVRYTTENNGLVEVGSASTTTNLRLEQILDGLESENAENMNSVIAYPNPFKAELQLKGYKGAVSIHDLTGNLYFETTINENETIDASNWPSGFYLLKVGNKVQKIVKQD